MIPVRKSIHLEVPYGSELFCQRVNAFYELLAGMHKMGVISASPSAAMYILDMFSSAGSINPLTYHTAFGIIPEEDRKTIDRILHNEGLISAALKFDSKSALELGLIPDREYRNEDLVRYIYEAGAPNAPALAEPATYVQRVIGEEYYELFNAPRSVRTVLAYVLLADNPHYQRTPIERARDAITLAGMIYNYASHPEEAVKDAAITLTGRYVKLFSNDIAALHKLKIMLETAAAQAACIRTLRISEQVGNIIVNAMKTDCSGKVYKNILN